MKKALTGLIRVVIAITCFDVIVWLGDCYWRTTGEQRMEESHRLEWKKTKTERALNEAANAVSSYVREKGKTPRKLTDAIEEKYRLLDGWDNKMRIEKTGGGVVVVSAGPDGDFETSDDNMVSELQISGK